MRIGTWNLAGRWSDEHARLILSWDCDVLLLTEVAESTRLHGYELHTTSADMLPGKRWAGIASRTPLVAAADPHRTSAMVRRDRMELCSSVLPWPLWKPTGVDDPWSGRQGERMASTCAALEDVLARRDSGGDLIWGGDWNTPLQGSLAGFDRAAQGAVLATVDAFDLQVPTAGLPSATGFSIDHIAVPRSWSVTEASHHAVDSRLSDHGAYVVDVDRSVAR